ncbi:MAG: tetratricopeptide repeat-containing sensor histidine kinase [Bacteroidia bacterium]
MPIKTKILRRIVTGIMLCGLTSIYAQNLDSLLQRISEIKDDTLKATLLDKYSRSAFEQAEYEKGLKMCLDAAKIHRKEKNKSKEAQSLIHAASALVRMRQYDEGIRYLKTALDLKTEVGDKAGEALVYCNLSATYFDQKKYRETIEYGNKALSMLDFIGDKRLIGICKGNIGNAYLKTEQFRMAEKELNGAVKVLGEIKDTATMLYVLTNLGDLNLAEKKYDEAIKAYKNVYAIQLRYDDKYLEGLVYEGLYKCYKESKDYGNALDNLEKVYDMEQKMYDAELNGRIAQEKENYEANKREQDIVLLKAENEKSRLNTIIALLSGLFLITVLIGLLLMNRNRKRRQLLEIEKNKAVFEQQALRAQMNPHFIFNSLNSIQNYILNNETQVAYDYLAKFSRLIRQVLMNSQQNDITLKDELELLRIYVDLEHRRFKNRFDYKINCEDNIPLDIKLPVMLIQPFVENAIWHGIMNLDKSVKGFLKIEFSFKNDILKITVEDNGIGREAAEKRRVDNEYKSIGMMFTRKRMELLKTTGKPDARIEIIDLKENGAAKGTRVEIILPI